MNYKKILFLFVILTLASTLTQGFGETNSTIVRVPQDYATIQDAVIHSNSGDTIQVSPGTYNVNLFITKNLTFVGENAESTILDGNKGYAVILANLTSISISGFTITNADYGIVLEECNESLIKENKINCSSTGIWLHYSNNSIVTDNYVSGATRRGIVLCGGSSYNNVTRNTMSNNFYGIGLTGTNNLIYHNNFINNQYQAVMIVSFPNFWNNSIEGNYWSDYNETTFNNYGIGSVPYVIDTQNIDYHPLRSPYMLGDVNHDGRIDIKDVSTVAKAFGAKFGDPSWNPYADIDETGEVTMIDVGISARNFGRVWTNP
jgi:parallel beta-helix repeat protein